MNKLLIIKVIMMIMYGSHLCAADLVIKPVTPKTPMETLLIFKKVFKELIADSEILAKAPANTRLAALVKLQNGTVTTLGIQGLKSQIDILIKVAPTQLKDVLLRPDLTKGLIDLMTNLSSALATISLTDEVIKALPSDPKAPANVALQNAIIAFNAFKDPATEMLQTFDALIANTQKNPQECAVLLT